VEINLHLPAVALRAGERPEASPLARLQAEKGLTVTNLRHRNVHLNDLDRLVLTQADGTRDRPALIAALADALSREARALEVGGRVIRDPDGVQQVLRETLDASLDRLARAALLIGSPGGPSA